MVVFGYSHQTGDHQKISSDCGWLPGFQPSVPHPYVPPRHQNSTQAELLEDYYQSGRMLLRMSLALGRIVLAGREMTRLAGCGLYSVDV
ncbi:ATP-binding cassette sub-family D member 3-like [Spea bombifrons]|uniref:ATP-binding cassette sub-family D member 3-like n=1 Tax=Spea bombifrons TaxID=233779 RepID=UPI002348F16D|nr:ATP-binding cassette sub-family D member 3-like [Spea bombifrons]